MDTTSKFSNALVGMEMFEVIFTDTQNGVRYEFTTSSKNGPLYAYNVHSKQIIDTGKSLTVELCRQDAILSMQKRVCKKYENQTADQLVGDIIVNELGQTKKGVFTQKSINKISFIPPNSRPLDVLIWAKKLNLLVMIKNPRQRVESILVLDSCSMKHMISIITFL